MLVVQGLPIGVLVEKSEACGGNHGGCIANMRLLANNR